VPDLAARWPLDSHQEVRDELLAAYAEDGRGYHDRRHLAEVLDHLELLGCADVAVRLAAWFHDAVYDTRPDAESRSARWVEHALPDPPAGEVARLVRLTEHHRPEPDDERGAALCDADLAILAAEPARYDEYVRGVREEYAHLSDAAFAEGRAAVLRALVDRPFLFLTARGRDLWEERARANVAAELRHLG
jgi:predicted metal-dependent HD superfamily phosphohydrolase